MTFSKIGFVFAGLVATTTSGWSQRPDAVDRGILGYLDAKTGAFKPLPHISAESEQPAAVIAPVIGKLVFNFTINVASQLAASDVISCGTSALIIDIALSGTNIDEEASTIATRSGSKATCTVTIPYSWPLTSAAADMVQLAFTITAGTTTGVAARVTAQSIAVTKVPASGSTTTYSLTPTI